MPERSAVDRPLATGRSSARAAFDRMAAPPHRRALAGRRVDACPRRGDHARSRRTADRRGRAVDRLADRGRRRRRRAAPASSASSTTSPYFAVDRRAATAGRVGARCASSARTPDDLRRRPARRARSRWSSGTSGTRTARAAARRPVESQAGWHAALPRRRQRALPAHRPRGDHAGRTTAATGCCSGRGHALGRRAGSRRWPASSSRGSRSRPPSPARSARRSASRSTDVRYVASQPWPFPASLMLGFRARLDGDPALHLDPVEMAEAGWFTRARGRRGRDWVDTESAPTTGARCKASRRSCRSPAT